MEYTFAQYTTQYGECTMLVAYDGCTPVAVQFTDRNHDPRTGYAIRKGQGISDLPYVRITPQYFMVRIDQTHVDTNVYTDTWRRLNLSNQVEHAKTWLANWVMRGECLSSRDLPVWALVLPAEPVQVPLPEPVVAKPKRKSKQMRELEDEYIIIHEIMAPVKREMAALDEQ